MKFTKYGIAFLLALALSGCQQEEQSEQKPETADSEVAAENTEKDKQIEAETEEAEKEADIQSALADETLIPIPQDTVDLINQPVGKLAGYNLSSGDPEENTKLFLEAFGDFPPLPEEASEKELDLYFDHLYSIIAMDFQDPQIVVDNMKFALSGSPEADPRFSFKENYNVEIILDASGSMANVIDGKTRMELAKEAIRDFVSQVPEEANVSLRVYGHTGTGDEADKAASCAAIDEVYERGPYDSGKFEEALNKFEPAGWTPVAGALESAKESFAGLTGEENTNLIYLVSDGIETCDGDPVAMAKSFAESDIAPIINVIGFNTDAEAQKQLQEVAKEANGVFTNVTSGEQLAEEFDQIEEVLRRWKSWKLDANFDVLAASNASSNAIQKFSNEWSRVSQRQYLSLAFATSKLRNADYITQDQLMELRKKGQAVEDLSDASKKEVVEHLKNLQDQGLEDMRKEIEALYPEE